MKARAIAKPMSKPSQDQLRSRDDHESQNISLLSSWRHPYADFLDSWLTECNSP